MKRVVTDVISELSRAMEKFPMWPRDPIHAFAVVSEECGECQKEVLQMAYEPHKSSRERVREEAIQLVAMGFRFLLGFDRYVYLQSEQHYQDKITPALEPVKDGELVEALKLIANGGYPEEIKHHVNDVLMSRIASEALARHKAGKGGVNGP